MPKEFSPHQILALEIEENDAQATTIGQYLFTLTAKVWFEQEGFNGKRPFGNSSWSHDIIHALILNKVIDGVLDEDGFVKEVNTTQVTKVMTDLFTFLNKADYSSFSLPPEPRDWFLLEFSTYGELVGSETYGYTKKEAEDLLETYNYGTNLKVWKAIQITE